MLSPTRLVYLPSSSLRSCRKISSGTPGLEYMNGTRTLHLRSLERPVWPSGRPGWPSVLLVAVRPRIAGLLNRSWLATYREAPFRQRTRSTSRRRIRAETPTDSGQPQIGARVHPLLCGNLESAGTSAPVPHGPIIPVSGSASRRDPSN
jgi:hypothetical protein